MKQQVKQWKKRGRVLKEQISKTQIYSGQYNNQGNTKIAIIKCY